MIQHVYVRGAHDLFLRVPDEFVPRFLRYVLCIESAHVQMYTFCVF